MSSYQALCDQLRRSVVVELDSHVADDPLRFYRDFVATSTPCVIRGMASGWPAVQRWRSAATLASRLGPSAEISVASTPNGRADAVTVIPATALSRVDAGSDDVNRELEAFVAPLQSKRPVSEFLRQLLSQSRRIGPPWKAKHARSPPPSTFEGRRSAVEVVYAQAQNNSLPEEFAALEPDLSTNVREFGDMLFGGEPEASNMWIGSAHSVTTMHQDWSENLYVVVTGTKVFRLIPPWEAPFVGKRPYPSAAYVEDNDGRFRVEASTEAVGGESPSPAVVPWIRLDASLPPDDPVNVADAALLRRATVLSVDVGPGDALYLPAAWFHQVEQRNDPEGKVVAVNYWYDMTFGPGAVFAQHVAGMVQEQQRCGVE